MGYSKSDVGRACAAQNGRLSVRSIAGDMAIPVAFLPQVMRDLVAAGLIEGMAGRAGGYRLSRPAPRISVLEIVEAVEGDSRRSTCVLRGGPCGRTNQCDAHEVFFAARAAMLDRLRAATLADLVRRENQLVATALPE